MAWCSKRINGDDFPDGVEVTLNKDGNMRRYLPERTCKLEPLKAFYVTVNMLDQTEWGVCSNCGTASPIDATYCCECGAKVVDE